MPLVLPPTAARQPLRENELTAESAEEFRYFDRMQVSLYLHPLPTHDTALTTRTMPSIVLTRACLWLAVNTLMASPGVRTGNRRSDEGRQHDLVKHRGIGANAVTSSPHCPIRAAVGGMGES